uniref:U-box domain-containing protein 62 n=1 Tax=Noccaea caerulescens TaxID=107243 RepID=A0A1J3JIP9_NOCCA
MHRLVASSPITPSSFSAAVSAAADVSAGLNKSPLSHPITVTPISAAYPSGDPMQMMSGSALARVRLSEILPYEGAPSPAYIKAVETLSVSLMRYNASVIELGSEDAALLRCGLEAARLYFRTRSVNVSGKGNRGLSMYRAGRSVEDLDSSPPCMAEIFRCLGKVARAALSAIARHLRLRSDVFNHMLDDFPLAPNEVSSSVLLASYAHASIINGKPGSGGGNLSTNIEIEKGLLTLFCSDGTGIQVCDPNGRWYAADNGCGVCDILLITGKALSHATAGLRPAASYRATTDHLSGSGRASLAFRLMPKSNAILDCSPIEAAGHIIPQSYVPVSVSQFMDNLLAENDTVVSPPMKTFVSRDDVCKEPSLRSILSDPISGAFLEDASVVSCGHSFGGLMLRRVLEMSRCTLCNAEIDTGSLVPNHALRAAALAVKQQDDKRLFHNAAMRRRRKEMSDQMDVENGDPATDDGLHRVVHYPFAVNEKVLIKGNRRTPEKFVGKEAIVTSQCLNGWYLLKIIESGDNVRLQYRSLKKLMDDDDRGGSRHIQPLESNSL